MRRGPSGGGPKAGPVMPSAQGDPFAYLEDANDPRTVAWTAAQNARTRELLDGLPARPGLMTRFAALLEADALGIPVEREGRIFFTARRAGADQASLYVREAAAERVLLDPLAFDATGLTTIDWWFASPLGNFVAFGLSQNGDERSTLHVLAAADGGHLGEAIPDTRYASLAWLPDESGFFYSRRIGGDYDIRLFRHELGSPWESDPLVFGDGRKREETLSVNLSANGRWLTVEVHDGWTRSDLYLAAVHTSPLRFATMVEGRDALYFASPSDDAVFVRTDDDAPRCRVMVADPERPQREAWRELVAESSATLEDIAVMRGALGLHYLENVASVVRLWRDGHCETLHEFSGRSVIGWSARESATALYILHASFFETATVSRIDAAASPAASTLWDRAPTHFDPSAYDVEQLWYASKDGTRIPMFVLGRVGIERDGRAPAVLYGYGGFNISLVPSYLPSVVPWLDAGGVYAIANVRGGGEFGESWHRSGMRDQKQNVFDDFIAAAEFLSASGIADPARIAIMGGSNGGLLVAAVAVQRPALARAIVCLVPLTDMLRFPEFLIARLWISEYGDPGVPAEAAILRAYSPYHNVGDGVAYPPMLIATAADDSRVDPMHARKFAARVQAATSGDGEILLYVEPNAGHGVGKPRHKVVAELADRWSFLGRQLGVVFG
ncbi:MAG: S9 family peptidase [Candidatus Eremiobacteraeota bacterium]|nr:S9 family peptidase [Candidatus Eremiobacteraeota bacterium]